MKWRPIKTAPKDKLILLASDEHPEYPLYVCVGRWIDIPHTNTLHSFYAKDGRVSEDIKTVEQLLAVEKKNGHWHDGYAGIMESWSTEGKVNTWEYRGGILFRPTHWMPLPKPPTRIKRKK
jgi:hypothetical protein